MQIDNLSDNQLARYAQQKIEYFEQIIKRFEKKLMRYIMRISDFSKEEAEEILQEVFIKTWRNLKDFDGTTQFSSWIFRITHNETISAYRKCVSRGKNQKEALEHEDFMKLPSNFDLETEITHKLDKENIQKILNLLPQNYKEVLVLKFLEEKTTAEISDILQKPEKTISTLIHRAKKDFKDRGEKFNLFPKK